MRGSRGNDTKSRILELLKRNGAMTPGQLAEQLGMTGTAIRQHLTTLAQQEWIEPGSAEAEKGELGRGRPPVAWRLTSLATELFPDRHGELVASLLVHLREAVGEAGLDRVIDARSRAQVEAYRRSVPAAGSLAERLRALARERTREGYMADVRRDGEAGFLLVEHHCPICVAAGTCAGLCRAELDVFRQVLGKDVVVARISHIPSGADRCAYRVTPVVERSGGKAGRRGARGASRKQ